MAKELKGAFIGSLKRTNKDIKAARAESIGSKAETIYRRKIEDMDLNIADMEREQEDMLDMSPTSAVSLQLASDFKAEEWSTIDIELATKIRNQKIKLHESMKRYEYLFGEVLPINTNIGGIS